MGRMTGKWAMKKLDVSKSSPACFSVAVDEPIKNLKPYLENLKFKVVSLESGLDHDEIHQLLRKAKINFFITIYGENYLDYFWSSIRNSPKYSLLWVTPDLLKDLDRTSRAISEAILYDLRFRWAYPSYVKINGAYITELPKIKKKYLRNKLK